MLTEKLEFILAVLDSPKDAIETVIFKRQPALSLLIFLLANFSILVSNLINNKLDGEHFVLKYILFLILNAVVLVAGACVFHFVAELLNGKGDIISLYSLMNFSLTPLLLLIPSAVIGRFLGSDVSFVLTIFLCCWSLGFIIYAVEKLYGVPSGTAVAVVFSPVLIVLLVSFAVFILSIGGIVALLL